MNVSFDFLVDLIDTLEGCHRTVSIRYLVSLENLSIILDRQGGVFRPVKNLAYVLP